MKKKKYKSMAEIEDEFTYFFNELTEISSEEKEKRRNEINSKLSSFQNAALEFGLEGEGFIKFVGKLVVKKKKRRFFNLGRKISDRDLIDKPGPSPKPLDD